MLLDKGADINAQGGKYGNALQAAIYGSRDGTVRILRDAGAHEKEYPIHLSSVLLAEQMDGKRVTMPPNTSSDRDAKDIMLCKALQSAALNGHKNITMFWLDLGTDVNAQGGEYGSALQAAAYGGHEDIVSMLLDKGADINAQGGKYGNALNAAIYWGHESVVSMLLDKGADINTQGGKYGNAL
ncbi:unnamed protein product [Fusarium graminearum]|nr:unnamed protein product [Fusarium graminearum]